MNRNLAIVYDDRFNLHRSGYTHPENPSRLVKIIEFLKERSFLDEIDIIAPIPAAVQTILSVHTEQHFKLIKESSKKGSVTLDSGDTYIVKDSFNAALLAAGSGIKAVDLVMKKEYRNIFCAVRPPGHHAESSRAMGFCLFNNIAVAAQYSISQFNIERTAVIDFDVHHGNGTQEIFYESEKVFYISLHQHPLYPGTGFKKEKGKGKGLGYTLNFPIAPGNKGDVYIEYFTDNILKELDNYKPQIIFLSAGFDAHKDDPLANMDLTEKDFSTITFLIRQFSEKNDIPIISMLEGGYNLTALAGSVYEHLKELNS
jgi:acetoin utilization deacetylase AcuC-like enzyme